MRPRAARSTMTDDEMEAVMLAQLRDPGNPHSAAFQAATRPVARLPTEQLVGALNEHVRPRPAGKLRCNVVLCGVLRWGGLLLLDPRRPAPPAPAAPHEPPRPACAAVGAAPRQRRLPLWRHAHCGGRVRARPGRG
jgi:hypothetical protein